MTKVEPKQIGINYEDEDGERYIDIPRAATLLRCSDESARRYFQKGMLSGYQLFAGAKIWIKKKSVTSLQEQIRRQVEQLDPPPAGGE